MLVVNTNSNEFRLAVAAGGGPTAPTAVISTAVAAALDGRPLSNAVGAKRLHASAAPDAVFVEPGYADSGALRSRGHEVTETDIPSRVNAMQCGSGSPTVSRCAAVSDPRGAGLAQIVGE
jgi:gamma-glutamyltranspeptidase/glutathione hydrolase